MRIERYFGGVPAVLATLALIFTASPAQARSGAAAASQTATAHHPISGLPIIALTVTHQHRQRHFRVELADTAETQEKGLMFRTAMAPDDGMIFPMPDRPASFWMRNTVIPLDIIFIGVNGRILNIAANAKPYDETPLPSLGAVSGVLELNGGRAAQLGIGPGDLVKW